MKVKKMSHLHPSIDSVFSDALMRRSGEERTTYLDSVCGANAELRQRVERLLQAHSDAQSFLESPAIEPVATSEHMPLERPGTQLGPYKLLQQIGEGGFGVVYMAEQFQIALASSASGSIMRGQPNTEHLSDSNYVFFGDSAALANMGAFDFLGTMSP